MSTRKCRLRLIGYTSSDPICLQMRNAGVCRIFGGLKNGLLEYKDEADEGGIDTERDGGHAGMED